MSLTAPAVPSGLEETACGLCGRRAYRPVSLIDRRGRPLRTVMCDVCGLVWTNPRPTDAAVDAYYANDYRQDYSGAREPTRRKIVRGLLGAAERRDACRELLRPPARVLDVGCGAGEFVYLLRRAGLDAAGIEPGREFAEFSRRVLQVPIEITTVDRAAVSPGSRHVITMFHMLEHVADPARTLAAVAAWLDPAEGRLVVEVPNVNSTVQAPRHRFHFAHLHSYSAATLEALGAKVGLAAVSTRFSPDGGNLTCVFRRDPSVAPLLPSAASVAETRRCLLGHGTVLHYLGVTPYRRTLGRLTRRLQEDRLLARLPTMEAVLAWSAEL